MGEDQRKCILEKALAEGSLWWKQLEEGEATVVGPDGRMLSRAPDARSSSGGNPCNSAVLCAMGKAGSSVNSRECAVVWRSAGAAELAFLGETSLGACELFRPAALVTRGPV